MAYAEVAIDGDGDHDQGRERDVGRDQEMVRHTHEVVTHAEGAVLHVHRVGDDDKAGDEIDER